MNNERFVSSDIWPITVFYDKVKRYFHISDRMVRKYISKGLIPPPDRRGKKAFYDLKKTKVWEHLQLIKLFQSRYNLSLDDIKNLIDKYRDKIVDLNIIVGAIERIYNSPTKPSPFYVDIRDKFLDKIQRDVLNLKRFDIKVIKNEVTGKNK